MMIFFCLGLGARAEYQVPELQGPVMDQVGVLPDSFKQQLTELLLDFNRRGKAQIQVLIIDSLQGEVIESLSIRIADQWKLGSKEKDNGILFLISMKERKMRIEVGQGLEGAIPDVYAKRIISDGVRPLFKHKRYSDGVYAGVTSLMRLADKEFADEKQLQEQPQPLSMKSNIILFLVFGLFAFVIIAARGGGGPFIGGGWGGGGWPGGGGGSRGGGSWSGGGGGFSGGGASGDWE
jgi:uncharacterized protein